METSFHAGNRKTLENFLPNHSVAVLFSGTAPRQSADAYYPFFCNRNFLYLTGVDFPGLMFLIRKENDRVEESIYIPPKDPMAERWTGHRFSKEEVTAKSGISDVRDTARFEADFCQLVGNGDHTTLWLDLYLNTPQEQSADAAHSFAATAAARYPFLQIRNLLPQLRRQRTIKQPCEIDAMRKSMIITRDGILAMMHASRPGMYEYEYKAEFDYALTKHGVLSPAYPSIIAVGRNNFCIHYYGYTGRAQDGDMVLNDVAACWDNEVNDVSRGWPVNGKFTEAQAELYQCAYLTSEYMFHTIRPGMPMASVDRTAHQYCFEQLRKLGKLKSFDQIGKYMWHNGAHHIGYDVHDAVDMAKPVSAGMVFCVDIGIYDEEQNIGFRLEDNCLVTKDGCENLSTGIPRSIEEIETAMRK